jgi:hypothetical protein
MKRFEMHKRFFLERLRNRMGYLDVVAMLLMSALVILIGLGVIK